jgi:hypothetical protein
MIVAYAAKGIRAHYGIFFCSVNEQRNLLYKHIWAAPGYRTKNSPAKRPSPTTVVVKPKRVAAACIFSNGLPFPPAGPTCVAWGGADDEAPRACVASAEVGAAVCVVSVDINAAVVVGFIVLTTLLPVNMVSGPITIGTMTATVCPSPSVVVCVKVLVVVPSNPLPPPCVVAVVVECSGLCVVVGAAPAVAVAHSYASSIIDLGIASPEPAQ